MERAKSRAAQWWGRGYPGPRSWTGARSMPSSWPARGLGLRGSRAASCSSRVMQHRGCTASAATIDVVQADDVVLAEIAAGLHLDQFERDPARIGEPMDRAARAVDRLR